MEKFRVGIIGATGMVGQRFVLLTANHPWFTPVVLAASAHSAGKPYAEAIGEKWHMADPIPESVRSMVVMDAEADAEEIAKQVDFVFCAVNMKKDEIKALEERYAKLECPVVSNNSAHRHTPDVPMVVPEINADHIRIIDAQRKRLGTKRGFIAVKSNCSLQSYVPALHPLMKYGIEKALVCTYQAISGAGKTFTMQLIARRMRLAGTPVYIIAPLKGHEFYRQAKALNGTIIRIVPGSPDCINVMEIRKIDHTSSELLDGPMPEQSELAAKIQKLHIFFSLLIPDLSNEERQLLDEAIVTTYRNKGITYDNASLDNPAHPGQYREMPILGDLHAVLAVAPETRRIANILNRLVHGSASSFNRQTNVNLDNSYVVIDISELSGDLLTVGMYIGLDYMWDKAKEDLTRRKQIFIDEVWQIIGASSNALAANYVFEAVKTIRGYGGGVLVATQDLNDFFSLEDGKYGRGILNNCKIKIILNLEEEEAQRVQSVLKLTDAEIDNITRFERGSALIVTNSNNVTVDMRCSEEEKDLITTDRDELRRIVERKMQNQTETEES